ncbi:MAG: agmatinase [Candidatus Hydrothermarchaeales archaeon]
MHTIPQTFARRELSLDEAEFAVLGIPYDSSESYRTGSRFGPSAIREASRDLEDYDMEEDFDLLGLKICDLGDVEVSFGNFDETCKRATETISEILKHGVAPVCLGGEHILTYFSATALEKNTFFVIYDAHLDYREDYLENRFSHASVTRRIAEEVGPENILVIGVRSVSKEELKDAKKDGLEFITTLEFYKDKKGTFKRISDLTTSRRVYLSIDLDVIDPAEASGVCNPDPGGIYYKDIIESFSFLKGCKLEGLDICELAPAYDSYSQILAAKLVYKALAVYKG